ncbi:MAG TPA: nucleoside-diphosphate kinase [Pseudonocardiaceae bacterium]|nr:nucleoside-diphosphate kinase [Pseudonocardiaceae bacterium]
MSASSFWSTHVFVLASPDALLRGLGLPLVQRLRREGFAPVAGKLVRTTPDMIDALYADVIAGSWQTWRYRLVDLSFAVGPTLALICRYTGPVDDPHELMRQRKGSSHPHLSAEGTIRRHFGAINNVLGIMHASDGSAESEKDSSIFGLTESDAITDRPLAREYVDYLAELSCPVLPENRGYLGVLAGVRARILLSTLPELPRELVGKVRSEFGQPAELAADDAGNRLSALLTESLPEALLEALTCEFTPEWREEHPRSRLWEVLHRYGVALDAWERLVLDTSLYFPSVRTHTAVVVSR